MTLLLDTHALIWALMEPRKLSRGARESIEDSTQALLVSSASVYELLFKIHKRQLTSMAPIARRLDFYLTKLGAEELPITHRHARVAAELVYPHFDPFDRILAAQSIVEGIPIATRDAALQHLGADVRW